MSLSIKRGPLVKSKNISNETLCSTQIYLVFEIAVLVGLSLVIGSLYVTV